MFKIREKIIVIFLIINAFVIQAASCSFLFANEEKEPLSDAPKVVTDFLLSLHHNASGENLTKNVKEQLWSVYPKADELKKPLIEFVKNGKDGPGVIFAALSLIPFHDPETVKPVLDRAMKAETSNAARWWLLNTAPYILSMGDVFYMGDGSIDDMARELSRAMYDLAEEASRTGLGHAHAMKLRELYETETENSEYGLVLWHASAYLVGTLDLSDLEILSFLLNPEHQAAFANVMDALSLASNRDFLAELREKERRGIKRGDELASAKKAKDWWRQYLSDNPSGDWLPAVVSGFQESGYKITGDLKSNETKREVLRALNSKNRIILYNAYRLLNYNYNTHFDLERIFHYGKYGGSFLFTFGEWEECQLRLKKYWTKRLQTKRN